MTSEEKEDLVGRLRRVEGEVEELDDLVRGDDRRGSEGLVSKVDSVQADVSTIRESVEKITERDAREDERQTKRDAWWKWGAGIVAALVVLLLGIVIRLLLGLPA